MISLSKNGSGYLDGLPPVRRIIVRNAFIAVLLWIISLVSFAGGFPHQEVLVFFGILIPFIILYYGYSWYRLIPSALYKKRPFRNYMGKAFLFLCLSALPVGLLTSIFAPHPDAGIGVASFNAFINFFFTSPLLWYIHKRLVKGEETIARLETKLGQSTASFDFLRSQINPHFLFNALNTVYGTALQEKAERTSEGIEKLADMMRFMLQENMQEKIALTREIDYLENYISLQRLRTDVNPSIIIETHIEKAITNVQIAPMLLIPFVENAFKHGISFREPSHIKVSLELKEDKLYFDVTNSRHQRNENDPEKDQSGIGLNNVQQRLKLLYKNRHELIIRETAREYFVHLTVQLT